MLEKYFNDQVDVINVKAGHLMSRVTLSVRLSGVTSLMLRLRIAKWLIRLAAWFIGTKCTITLED